MYYMNVLNRFTGREVKKCCGYFGILPLIKFSILFQLEEIPFVVSGLCHNRARSITVDKGRISVVRCVNPE